MHTVPFAIHVVGVCRWQQCLDPAGRPRQEALQHEGLQELPCMEERLLDQAGKCTKQTVCCHELADYNNLWQGHVTVVS